MHLPDGNFWNGRRVLITGHTGFKGIWLTHWLERMGSLVHGVALPPKTDPSLYAGARPTLALGETLADISAKDTLRRAFVEARPQIVIHLAAMALVPEAQQDPIGCYSSNVMGTVQVLEACRQIHMPEALLLITTDKVYSNDDDGRIFGENDSLGGVDPYSASKTCCEFIVISYRKTLLAHHATRIGVARAGNVIGPGDWAADRLVPDTLRALQAGQKVGLRQPDAIRPWQHVLEPLTGYLLYCEALAHGQADLPPALNFGPPEGSILAVHEVVQRLAAHYGLDDFWYRLPQNTVAEKHDLRLSSALAGKTLGWSPRLDTERAIRWTGQGYRALYEGMAPAELIARDIARFEAAIISP